ncbi:unnamed protein product [Moneuplotes crassus]|uniref:Uncharacterized protein n=1 Tax=Euplotes crassus TaxID=5936 RepID=A0AAD1UK09_EUPCR|nr:unnamed protein product [Moneuplotes crassus]
MDLGNKLANPTSPEILDDCDQKVPSCEENTPSDSRRPAESRQDMDQGLQGMAAEDSKQEEDYPDESESSEGSSENDEAKVIMNSTHAHQNRNTIRSFSQPQNRVYKDRLLQSKQTDYSFEIKGSRDHSERRQNMTIRSKLPLKKIEDIRNSVSMKSKQRAHHHFKQDLVSSEEDEDMDYSMQLLSQRIASKKFSSQVASPLKGNHEEIKKPKEIKDKDIPIKSKFLNCMHFYMLKQFQKNIKTKAKKKEKQEIRREIWVKTSLEQFEAIFKKYTTFVLYKDSCYFHPGLDTCLLKPGIILKSIAGAKMNSKSIFKMIFQFKTKKTRKKLSEAVTEKNRMISGILIMLSLFFSKDEMLQLFMQFIKNIDPNEVYKFTQEPDAKKKAYFNLNYYADEKHLGKERFKALLNLIKIQASYPITVHRNKDLSRPGDKKMTFPQKVYKKLMQHSFDKEDDHGENYATFEVALPLLLLCFLSKIVAEVEEIYHKFQNYLGLNSNTSHNLLRAFEKNKLDTKKLTEKLINYRMTEKVVISELQTVRNIGTPVLVHVKERMQVGKITNLNGVSQAYISKDFNQLGFGKWLAVKILQKKSFHSLQKMLNKKKNQDQTQTTLAFLKDEKLHTIAAFLEDFIQNKGCRINEIVHRRIKQAHPEKSEIYISEFTSCLHQSVGYFSDSISLKEIERAVYFFFMDLQMHECQEELKALLGENMASDCYLKFLDKPDLKIYNLKAMASHSYQILKSLSDKFFCYVMMETCVEKFEKRVKGYDRVRKPKMKKRENNKRNALVREFSKQTDTTAPPFMGYLTDPALLEMSDEEDDELSPIQSCESEVQIKVTKPIIKQNKDKTGDELLFDHMVASTNKQNKFKEITTMNFELDDPFMSPKHKKKRIKEESESSHDSGDYQHMQHKYHEKLKKGNIIYQKEPRTIEDEMKKYYYTKKEITQQDIAIKILNNEIEFNEDDLIIKNDQTENQASQFYDPYIHDRDCFIANTEFDFVKLRDIDSCLSQKELDEEKDRVISKGCVDDCKCIIF